MVAKKVRKTDAKHKFEKNVPLFMLQGMSIYQTTGHGNSLIVTTDVLNV